MVKKYWKLIVVIVVAGLALCIGAVATKQIAEQEQEVSIDQVPEAVKATILAEAKGGTIQEIEMETENGQTVYEAEVIIDGQETDIEVAANGTLLGKEAENDDDEGDDEDEDENEESEQQVSIDQVPPAVKATILKEAEGGTIKEIESETENGQTIYDADVVIDGKEFEIKVAADGTLLGKEAEDADDENDDDDDSDEKDD
jgi:uncharacterized membrane protein YkoI